MEWMKRVRIVFDTKEPREFLGDHNGKYQAFEMRLRSDGKCFYMAQFSKLCLEAIKFFEWREERWAEFLVEEVDTESSTEQEFLADAEKKRVELNGAYL